MGASIVTCQIPAVSNVSNVMMFRYADFGNDKSCPFFVGLSAILTASEQQERGAGFWLTLVEHALADILLMFEVVCCDHGCLLCVQLEEVQRVNSRATSPVTLASVAKERLHQVNLGGRSASLSSAGSIDTGAATDVAIPRVDFPRPKSFKPRAHTRRHSSDLDDPARPQIVASPVVSLPQPDSTAPLSRVRCHREFKA